MEHAQLLRQLRTQRGRAQHMHALAAALVIAAIVCWLRNF